MDENEYAAVRWRTLIAALPETSTVAMVGAAPGARTPWGPGAERCVHVGPSWRTELPAGTVTVVVVAAEPEALGLASTIAGERGGGELWALLPAPRDGAGSGGVLPAARATLRAAGWVAIDTQRLFCEPDAGTPVEALPRAARIDADTREVLLRARRHDDPSVVGALEERIAGLERDLAVHASLAVEHARTREAEAYRAHRLTQLERSRETDADRRGVGDAKIA